MAAAGAAAGCRDRAAARAPAAAAGEGVILVANMAAGTTTPSLVRWLRAELPQATVIESGPGQDLGMQLRLAAVQARILGVAGGDGTISAASAIALDRGLPLLVIPAGTFNHFATHLGIRSARRWSR